MTAAADDGSVQHRRVTHVRADVENDVAVIQKSKAQYILSDLVLNTTMSEEIHEQWLPQIRLDHLAWDETQRKRVVVQRYISLRGPPNDSP